MPLYEIQGPDGRLYEIEGPAGATREQVIQAVLANMPKPAPEPTFGGQVKEFFKGVPAGFVGTFGTAAEGLAALLPEETEKSVVGAVRRGVSAVTPEAAPGYEDTVGRKLGQAVGSIGSFIVPGGAATLGTRALGAGAGAQAAARLGTVGTLGGAAGAGEARQRAEVEGATPEEKSTATALGVLPGLLEIIPAQYLLNRVFKPASEIAKAQPQIIQRLKDLIVTAGIEGAQEAAQEFAQNLIAQGVYKPDQELIEGVGESAAYGAGAGAIAEALMQMALGRKASGYRDQLEKQAREESAVKRKQAAQQELTEREQAIAERLGMPLFGAEEAQRDLFVNETGQAQYSNLLEKQQDDVRKMQLQDELSQEFVTLKRQTEQFQQQAAEAADRGDYAAAEQAANMFNQLKQATQQLEKTAKDNGVKITEPTSTLLDAIEKKIEKAKADLKRAATLGETKRVAILGQQIRELEQQAAGETADLFGKENQARIREQEKRDKALFDTQQRILREREKLAEAKPAMTAFYEMMSQQTDKRRADERLQEIEQRQGKALERLEFGLQRMGLSSLGIKGNERVIAERDIDKGVIQPKVADVLQLPKAKENTRAVDILPQVEQAWEQARQKQAALVNDVAQGRLQLFNEQGELTPQGKEAVQNEARLKYLDRLRTVGREAQQTLEAQRLEDEFMSAPTRKDTRMEQIAGEAQREVAPAEEVAERKVPYTSRNDAFLALSDASYMLQKGEFLGGRDTPAPVPSIEEAQAGRLDKRIEDAEAALDKVRKQLKATNDPGARSNLERRKASVEGRVRILRAGKTRLTEETRRVSLAAIRDAAKDLSALEQRLAQAQKTGTEENVKQLEKQVSKAEAKLDALRARQPKSLFKTVLADAQQAADFLIQDAINEVKASRLARGFGAMPASEARNLETRLRIETNRFLDRVSTAQRTTGEVEEVPAVRVVDGKPVRGVKLRKKQPPIESRPYEKLGTALQTLRNEIEATVTEAKGLPQRGDVELEPVEKVAKPVEKPVKTTKKKIAERERAIKRDAKKQASIEAGKNAISQNQVKIRGFEDQLRKMGAEAARLKKAAFKDKNPQLRLAKVERIEQAMEVLRVNLRNMKQENAALAAALRALGVKADRVQSGAYILGMIENDQYLTIEELSEAGTAETNIARIEQLQKLKARQQVEVDAQQAKVAALQRRLSLNKFFEGPLRGEGLDALRKQIDVQKRIVSQAKDSVAKTKRDIMSALKVGTGAQAKQGIASKRFTPYQVDLAAKFLQQRADAILAQMRSMDKVTSDADALLKAKVGAITTPEGMKLPGVRVTTEMVPSLVRRPEADIAADQTYWDTQIEAATAAREAIKEANVKAGKPVRTPEWEEAHGKVKSLKNSLRAVKEFEAGMIPVRTKQDIFATPADVQEATSKRQRQTIDFLREKPLDAEEVAKSLEGYMRDKVVSAEKVLAGIDPKDAMKMRSAKAAVTRAKNQLSQAVVRRVRAELTEKEINAIEVATAKDRDFLVETDFDAASATDADIINSIEYRDDTIDFAIGEEATDLVDTAAANKRLAEVKKKAKAQGIDFEYYDSIENLPIGILKQMAKQGMDIYASQVRGGVHKGKVFVVVQNHNNLTDLERTLAHELVGHYTFEGMLGKDGMDNLLTRVDKSFGNVFELAKELGVYDDAMAAFVQGRNYGLDGRQSQVKALREVVAYTMEKRVDQNFMQKAKRWLQEMVGAMRNMLRKMGLVDSTTLSTSDLFYLMKKANQAFESGKALATKNSDGTISFATTTPVYNAGYEDFGSVGDKVIAPRKKITDRILGASVGMEMRTKWMDNYAPVEEMFRRGVDKGIVDDVKAQVAMYFARMVNQRNTVVSEFASTGVGKIVEEKQPGGQTAYMLQMEEGPNLKNVFEALDNADQIVGNKEAVRQAASIYLVAHRAQRVGADVVQIKEQLREDLGKDVTDAELKSIAEQGDKIPQFVEFRKRYNEYNKALVDFVVQAGALPKEVGKLLKQSEDYVPFYRLDGDTVNLVMPKEGPVRIGDIKNQPYLQELVGGDQLIVDVFTSSLRNTQLLTDMALRNLATRNIAFTLQEMGAARISNGDGAADGRTLRFKIDGEKKHAVIDYDTQNDLFDGIPPELLVQGLEGIKTMVPNVIRYAAMPTNFLKRMITLDPRYGLRQIARDSMQVALTSGANVVPIIEGLGETSKMLANRSETLKQVRKAGILSGNVISGTPEEMQRRLEDVVFGKGRVSTLLSGMEKFAMMGEASSKLSAYNSFKKQGLTDFQASIAAMETFNFTRRGMSPSAYYANMFIPFFNAGMQGLDLIYRAYKGNMPFNEQLKIKQKLLARGMMMAGMTMGYALLMQDDEAYKNATPEQRYGNWFVRIPFMDEPLKVPIPFELGLIFKSVPEGITNAMFADEDGAKVAKDLALQTLRSLPGGIAEAGIPIPAVIKPPIEVALNRSFFTGNAIVDARMENIDKQFQFRDKTPDMLKAMGPILELINLSPVQAETLIRGYTGGLGLGLMSITNPIFRTTEAGAVESRLTDVPIIGGLFQPNDAGRVVNEAYESMREVQSRQQTYKRLIERGEMQEAERYLKKNLIEISVASMGGSFTQRMGQLTKAERQIRALPDSVMSPEQKRAELDKLREVKNELSRQVVTARKEIERQAVR